VRREDLSALPPSRDRHYFKASGAASFPARWAMRRFLRRPHPSRENGPLPKAFPPNEPSGRARRRTSDIRQVGATKSHLSKPKTEFPARIHLAVTFSDVAAIIDGDGVFYAAVYVDVMPLY